VLDEILRYPVKSTLGERVPAVAVTERGIGGDRAWAVVDRSSGLVASAKHPRKWAALLTASSRVLDEDGAGVVIELPDGRVVNSGDPDCDDVLSQFLGRPVRLTPAAQTGAAGIERADPDLAASAGRGTALVLGEVVADTLGAASPPGTVFDHAPLHLVATATLRELAQRAPEADVHAARFRPNLVLDLGDEPFVENDLVGHRIRIGADVVLQVIVPTPRCVVPSLRHGALRQEAEVLRAVARHNRPEITGVGRRPCLGAYATVERAGTVRLGEAVSVS
jgi:uncharacterized protein YcbX